MTTATVECEGVPRDLGRDQGAAFAEAIRAACGGPALRRLADRLGGLDRASRRWLRDVRRHFPHQGEWIEGLARAAGVPEPSLVRAMRTALGADGSAVALAVVGADGVRLARTAASGGALRRMRPEGRFASVEVGSPLLTAPWVGVNEGGLAVAVVGGAEVARDACAASAVLLVRDCLERFEALESALAWCLGRPAAAGASILLADSTGEIAGVELRAGGRRAVRPDGGAVLLAGSGCDVAALQKSLAAADRDGFDSLLEAVLDERSAREAIRIDPAAHSLRASRDELPVFATG